MIWVHIYHTPDKDIKDYFLTEFRGLFFEREHWAKNFKYNNFYDYPISREFINSLPKDTRDKINKELSEVNQDELSKANNYFEYTKALAGETLQKLFFTKYPEKLWGISTKDLDLKWAPKRVQITEKRRAFYQDQWSAVGNEGSGTILNSLEEKIIKLGGIINLEEQISKIELNNNINIKSISTSVRKIDLMPSDLVINTTSCTVFSQFINFKTDLKYRV